MKRVLLLFTFVALVLAGVASADRPEDACCPAGEAGQAAQMQAHGGAHHAVGKCCGPKAEGQPEGMCMRSAQGEKACCGGDAEAGKACCEDGTCACCGEGVKAEGHAQGGCCEKRGEPNTKAGCCQKHDDGERKAGCCMKASAHGARS
jgi:hypothetical protein